MTPVSLSRWLGSKAWLARSYPQHIPEPEGRRRAFDCTAGACSIPLHWLARGHRVVIGDANPRLVGCLRNLQERPEAVIGTLAAEASAYTDAKDQREDFYTRRGHLNRLAPESLEASALFLFVLRAGFNGQYRESGNGNCSVAWGDPLNAKGKAYASRGDKPFRKDLVRADELRAIARLLKRADIRVGDFEATSADIRKGEALFCDPPYVDRSAFVGYSRGGFSLQDRLRLTAWLRDLDKRGVRWTLTDVATPESMAAHGLWTVDVVTVRRTVAANGTRAPAREAIVRNWQSVKDGAP
jgi:DNA adenine methylase